MSPTLPHQAPHSPGIAADLRAAARNQDEPVPAWHALILALLVCLFPRLRPCAPILTALDLPTPENRPAHCYDVFGRAPHAAVVALGLVPDWILVGSPGRGMRSGPRARRHPRHALAARAPPAWLSAPQAPTHKRAQFVPLT